MADASLPIQTGGRENTANARVFRLRNADEPPIHPGQRARRGKRPKHIVSIEEFKRRRKEADDAAANARKEETVSIDYQDLLFTAFWGMTYQDRRRLLDAAMVAANANGDDWTAVGTDGVRRPIQEFRIAGLLDDKETDLVMLWRRLTPEHRGRIFNLIHAMRPVD